MIKLLTSVKNSRKRHIQVYEDDDNFPIIDDIIMHDELEEEVLKIFKEHGIILTNDIDIIKILKKHYEIYNI